MSDNRLLTWLIGAFLVTGIGAAGLPCASAQQKKEADKTGSVTGKVTDKGGHWIDVKADGEEKARRYYCGSDQAALKAVKNTEVGSRVRLAWRYREVFRVVEIDVLRAPDKQK